MLRDDTTNYISNYIMYKLKVILMVVVGGGWDCIQQKVNGNTLFTIIIDS